MRTTRSAVAVLVLLALCGVRAQGQPATPASAGATDPDATTWTFSAAAYTYVVPGDRNYVQPTVTADRDWLHLEARYNYEDRDAASFWVGYSVGGGDELEWTFTPMLGGVLGNTTGVAPGYRASLSWRLLEFDSEGEYLFDTGDASDSFFFNWSELALVPTAWLRVGVVTQRTRVYEAERDIERGLFAGVAWKGLDLTVYVLDPDADAPTVVLAAAVGW